MAKRATPTHACEHCGAEYTKREAGDLVQRICTVCRFGYVRQVRWGLR